MRIFDEFIHAALMRMYKEFKSIKKLAAHLGVSPGQVSKMLKRQISHLSNSTWAKLEPLVSPHMEEHVQKLPRVNTKKDYRLEILLRILTDETIADDARPDYYNQIIECALIARKRIKKNISGKTI